MLIAAPKPLYFWDPLAFQVSPSDGMLTCCTMFYFFDYSSQGLQKTEVMLMQLSGPVLSLTFLWNCSFSSVLLFFNLLNLKKSDLLTKIHEAAIMACYILMLGFPMFS